MPTVIAFYFAFTRWTLFESEFIGLDNFRQFFSEQALVSGLKNTLIYAVVTSGLKVVLGMLLAVLLTGPIRSRGLLRSVIFFPVLVSTVAVGITFSVLLQPDIGLCRPCWPRWASPRRTGSATPARPCSRSPSSTSGRAWDSRP